jgi:AcrR family transcriptional regulator
MRRETANAVNYANSVRIQSREIAMTTAAVPTRRERQRTATLNEIKQTARRLVTDHGPGAISLRAIAREVGLSAAALYRYFPSLEALVADVCADVYDELRDAVDAAGAAAEGAGAKLIAMAYGFRRWSLAHTPEFALLFGTPVPGVVEMEEECESPDHPGARLGAVFLGPFAELWTELGTPAQDDDTLREQLAPAYAAHGDALPPAAMLTFLGGWTRLYGLVALEVFGHLRWAMDDVQPLFEAELAAFVRELTVG